MRISITHALTAVTGGVLDDTIDDIESQEAGHDYEAEDTVRHLEDWKAQRARVTTTQAVHAAAGMRGAA
ncbi:hypothetical protein OG436_39325 (plasmid) [Streptomyces caniferus]|uniref:hypothetical protein n=1 Tax=Streptomyces caniferus TaxID=285557 RepID=UPI002E2A98D8|nr:hypothetical protein [Streptomyces caniferus]